jgi:Uma2 family endonuclease
MALAVRQDELIETRQTITVPEEPMTWDDLLKLPDDGRRFELVDGVLLVSPLPRPRHQLAATQLAVLLHPVRPEGTQFYCPSIAWRVSESTVFEPDGILVRLSEVFDRGLDGTPLLVIEILSPSTRLRDLGLKRRAYEEAGLPWYWIVNADKPRLTVLRLVDGRFVEHAVVEGDEAYVATEPLAVTVVPSALVS